MLPPISPLPKPLGLEELEQKPKKILLAKGFADRVGLSKKDTAYTDDWKRLRDCILNGWALAPGFYRKYKGVDSDEMLQRYGIMHLHLGGQNSNVLLFLMQFPDHIVFLEITDHYHFHTKPPGSQLNNLHASHACMQVEEEKKAAAEARKAALKNLFKPKT